MSGWISISFLAVGALAMFALIWMARQNGKAEQQQRQHDEDMRRLRNVIEADARSRERIARGELLQDDGFKRD